MKLIKIERILSFLGGYSTAIIIIITMVRLVKQQAKATGWLQFVAVPLLLVFIDTFLSGAVFGEAIDGALPIAVFWIIYTVANLFMVHLQVKYTKEM